MDLNKTKRKRSVPDWMKSSSKSSPEKSNTVRDNRSPIQKNKRPNYPPISITKRKSLPKFAEGRTTQIDEYSIAGPSTVQGLQIAEGDNQEPETIVSGSKHIAHSTHEELPLDIDEVCMTVDDLTKVAQEIINEELQKNAKSMLGRSKKRTL